jgi:histone acetyltransferase MYST4
MTCIVLCDYTASFELCRVGGALGDTTPARLVICVDWAKVDEHMAKVSRSKTRIYLDPECLRWTPLVTTVPNPYQEEEKEVCVLHKGSWIASLKCTVFVF